MKLGLKENNIFYIVQLYAGILELRIRPWEGNNKPKLQENI